LAGEVKLCDFGLARLKNAAFVETVSNTAGTPAYQVAPRTRPQDCDDHLVEALRRWHRL
jgi:hypothetical protein